ncbi:hypothetical protein ACRRTK_008152 [Alexandromys fortis]
MCLQKIIKQYQLPPKKKECLCKGKLLSHKILAKCFHSNRLNGQTPHSQPVVRLSL